MQVRNIGLSFQLGSERLDVGASDGPHIGEIRQNPDFVFCPATNADPLNDVEFTVESASFMFRTFHI
jgi:hypothetical protein